MTRFMLTLSVAVFALLAAYCFYEVDAYETKLLANSPGAPDAEHAERISLHQGFIPVTHEQHMHHLLLELGAYGSVLICGLIIVGTTRK